MSRDNVIDSGFDYLKSSVDKFQKFSPGGHLATGIFLGFVIRSMSPLYFTIGLGSGIYAQQNYDLPRVKPKLERAASWMVDYLDSLRK